MDRQKILEKLDVINEYPLGTLTGAESTAEWSSISWLSLIIMADEDFQKSLKLSQFTEMPTVDDVVSFLLG